MNNSILIITNKILKKYSLLPRFSFKPLKDIFYFSDYKTLKLYNENMILLLKNKSEFLIKNPEIFTEISVILFIFFEIKVNIYLLKTFRRIDYSYRISLYIQSKVLFNLINIL
jgi:hypothetical protein